MSLLDWIFRRRRELELEEEIRSHLEMAARDRIESGETGDEARHAVRREFGNALLVKEVTREMWGWGWAERLLQDVRYTLRQLRGLRRCVDDSCDARAQLHLGQGPHFIEESPQNFVD